MSISSPLLSMFGRSPIKPLTEHMKTVLLAAEGLVPFFNAVTKGEYAEVEKIRDQIAFYENEADTLKQDLRLHLPKGLFLPVARSDILQILTLQDRIANKAKDIAGLVVGRQMQVPQGIAVKFLELVSQSVLAASQAQGAINELDQLLETGFRGNEVKIVEDMIIQLDKTEHDTDELQIEVRRALFQFEASLPPIDVMFLYQTIEGVGDLADRAQSVGRQLQLLLAR